MIQLHQDLLAYLCRERFVRFMRLHAPLHFIVVQVLALMDIGLPDKVQSSIVQVLGLEGCCIDHSVARVALVNDMLLD